MLKRTKLLDAGVSVAMPMLSPELDLTAAGTAVFLAGNFCGQRRDFFGRLDAALEHFQWDLLGNPSDFVKLNILETQGPRDFAGLWSCKI